MSRRIGALLARFAGPACVRQTEAKDCGAAALATVVSHHGLRLGLEAIRDLADTQGRGTSLLGLQRAAESLGFRAWSVAGGEEALAEIPLPAIAHWREDGEGHFVVVHRVGRRRIQVADPGWGVCRLRRDDFLERWTGYLLLVDPGEELSSAEHGDEAEESARSRWFERLREHRGALLRAFVFGCLFTISGLASSFFLRFLVDALAGSESVSLLDAMALGLVVVLVARALVGALRGHALSRTSAAIERSMFESYLERVIRLPFRYFEKRQPGEILSRADDVSKVRGAIGGAAFTLAQDSVFLVVASVVLVWQDPVLALVTFASIGVASILLGSRQREIRTLARRALSRRARLRSELLEIFSGIDDLRLFRAERWRSAEATRRVARYTEALIDFERWGIRLTALGSLLRGGTLLLVLWVGARRVEEGALTLGQLMLFYSLLGFVLAPLERLSAMVSEIQDAAVAAERHDEILALAPEPDPGRRTFPGLRREIRCESIDFAYSARSPVLAGLDLRVAAGETVAVVGESGCGKSTLLRLLVGLYPPSAGRVLVDGVDRRVYSQASLRERTAWVPQNPHVFEASFDENLTLGRPGVDDASITAAIRLAGLEDLVARLPSGRETLLGSRGVRLSAGQSQRLALARAVLVEPDFLLLDEATSHLDARTEADVRRRLRRWSRGRTTLLVAHRLSTVVDADRIVVMDRGRIVESGDHETLMDRGGAYRRLFQAQATPRWREAS